MKIEEGEIYFCGDTHGNFEEMFNKLEEIVLNNPAKAYHIINLGDNGLGFFNDYDIESYFTYEQLAFFTYNNIFLYFIRGNHDNPVVFQQSYANELEYKNNRIILIPDFTILELKGQKWLVFGGGISVDRNYRTNNLSYYSTEKINYTYLNYKSFDIEGIISHVGPKPDTNLMNISHYLKSDFTLERELEEEQQVLQNILKHNKPKKWFYGHYHCDWKKVIDSTELNCLGISSLNHF